MKLICINDKVLKSADGSFGSGLGLVEGKIYEATHIEKSIWGDDCYFIKELNGLKQCRRFKPFETDWVEEVLSKIKEEVLEENHVLINNL